MSAVVLNKTPDITFPSCHDAPPPVTLSAWLQSADSTPRDLEPLQGCLKPLTGEQRAPKEPHLREVASVFEDFQVN